MENSELDSEQLTKAYEFCIMNLEDHFDSYNKENQLSFVAQMAALSSAVKNFVPDLFFVGFYVVVDLLDQQGKPTGEQVIEMGPYLANFVATPRIEMGKGVCGTCWKEQKVRIVNDVSKCDNYIACDSETKSEIVLPIFQSKDSDQVVAVFDIDSVTLDRFTLIDQAFLTKIVDFMYL